MQSHELTHIQLESQARAVGRNRFFSTNPTTKTAALDSLAPELRRVARHLARPEDAPVFGDQLIAGVCGLIFNTPLDLLIERRLHRERPALRPAQILSLHTLAKEGVAGTFKPEIRQITPPTILRAAEAMNGLAALCLDDLSGGATAAFAPYATTETATLARKLWARWLELEAAWEPGREYAWVDEFAEVLGLRTWFTWIPDTGAESAGAATAHFPAHDLSQIDEPDLTLEGTSNPELLRKKHPVAVWFLLDALQRHARMTPEQIRVLTLEIALLGREGLDYASSEKKYQLRAIPGEAFSGLHLMCLMFAGFKRIAPGDDPQIDLEGPFLAALEEFNRRASGS